jgi:hypothetical protein
MTTSRSIARLILAGACATLATACAVKAPPAAGPDTASQLEAARTAVKEAEDAHAEEKASASYTQARELLQQAETGNGMAAFEAAIRAEGSARVALAEALCAAQEVVTPPPGNGASARAQADLKLAREERRRLEERLALVQHALERAETELVRSKARLKGIETKAEASSAIAEARILMRRLGARATAVALCEQSIAKAEQYLVAEYYGAATFFALKAQDLANRALTNPPRP